MDSYGKEKTMRKAEKKRQFQRTIGALLFCFAVLLLVRQPVLAAVPEDYIPVEIDGTDYTGMFSEEGGEDIYYFKIENSGRIILTATTEAGGVQYLLRTKMGMQILEFSSNEEGGTLEKTATLNRGTYYLIIKSEAKRADSYSFRLTYLETPKFSSSKKQKSGIKLNWDASMGAKGYQIYRKIDSQKWEKVKTTKKRTWTDTKATKQNTKYQYKIYAYNGKQKSEGSAALILYDSAAPVLTDVKSNSVHTLTAYWKTVPKVTGYELWYRREGEESWQKVDIPEKKKDLWTLFYVYEQKNYDVRIRSYKVIKEVTYYSKFSKTKRVKVQ